MDREGELIDRVAEKDDFFQSVFNDELDDWDLAKDFGEFLVRLDPEDALGHALLTRAHRHLGNPKSALEELQRCRVRIGLPSEIEAFTPFLATEERLLSPGHERNANDKAES